MELGRDDTHHLALLARLGLEDEEEQSITKDLVLILNYVAQLRTVDVSTAEPTAHVTGLVNVSREDVARQCDNAEGVLACAPKVSKHFVQAGSILE